jgi:hypothetical protein
MYRDARSQTSTIASLAFLHLLEAETIRRSPQKIIVASTDW